MDPHYLAPFRALLIPVMLLLYLGIGVAEPVHHAVGTHASQALVVMDWTTGGEGNPRPPIADYDCTLCQAQDREQPVAGLPLHVAAPPAQLALQADSRPFRGPVEVPSPRPRGPPPVA